MVPKNMKAICICLPEYPEAIERAKEHFTASGLDDVEFFWGINAPVAGLATSHCYERDHPGSGFRMGAKPTGIWLSHWILWNCLMRYPDERFMVLETDAKFRDGWKDRLDRALKDGPGYFDFLHIGHCCMEGHDRQHYGGDVWESKCAQCTHAYIVSRNCLPFLLKTLRKIWAPIDIQLQLECFPQLKTYAVMPRLVDQFDTELSP
jgi:GR25 family glycosyltransferase involved in LPS biosynthesis